MNVWSQKPAFCLHQPAATSVPFTNDTDVPIPGTSNEQVSTICFYKQNEATGRPRNLACATEIMATMSMRQKNAFPVNCDKVRVAFFIFLSFSALAHDHFDFIVIIIWQHSFVMNFILCYFHFVLFEFKSPRGTHTHSVRARWMSSTIRKEKSWNYTAKRCFICRLTSHSPKIH